MSFTSQGRSVLGKTVPSALCTARGRMPRAVSKTSGTVFPNTDRPWLVKNVYIFIDRFSRQRRWNSGNKLGGSGGRMSTKFVEFSAG